MTEKLYRFQKPDEVLLPGCALGHDVIREVPLDPRFPETEYYCSHPDCAVRGVKITEKYLSKTPPTSPPTMYCPKCRRKMLFKNYIEKEYLVPDGYDYTLGGLNQNNSR